MMVNAFQKPATCTCDKISTSVNYEIGVDITTDTHSIGLDYTIINSPKDCGREEEKLGLRAG